MVNEDNFKLYAKSVYDNPFCISEDEFEDDLKRLVSIKRMLTEYKQGRVYNIKMITNMFITFYNIFDHQGASNLLRFKLEEHQLPLANSFILFLNLPSVCDEYCVDMHEQLTKEFSK